tara:strand:+ start:6762 stop:7718 length:957 start_codon:yes stop_codon:yes gene_type:complete
MSIIDKKNEKIWINNINSILNDDDLIILYKWSYDEKIKKWFINLYDKFIDFMKEHSISLCDELRFYKSQTSKILLCNKSDDFVINNRVLCISSYKRSETFPPFNFDPNDIKKEILIRSCHTNCENFHSFPLGVFDRDDIEMIADTYRFRTFNKIKDILSSRLNKSKSIKNYAYFMQSATLNKDSKIFNPRYVELCKVCNDSKYVSLSQNQAGYWDDASNHLFNISVSWNCIESTKLWESLYMGVIPIVIEYYEENNFIENYYKDLPILYIKDLDLLNSEDFLMESYKLIMSKMEEYNFDKLRMSYWYKFLCDLENKCV